MTGRHREGGRETNEKKEWIDGWMERVRINKRWRRMSAEIKG